MKIDFLKWFGLQTNKEKETEEISENRQDTEQESILCQQIISDADNMIEKIEDAEKIKNFLLKIKRYVLLTEDYNGEFEYLSSDKEFDVDFRNTCKDIIREDIFNRIGQEAYSNRLDVFEPDLFQSFKELDYQTARADYFEAMYEYTRAINDINSAYTKSESLQRLWNRVEEADKFYKQMEYQLNN